MEKNNFDPNNTWSSNGNYFAMPYNADESQLVILSAPWDVTVSYGEGTAAAPDAIIDASVQLDLFDFDNINGYKKGIATLPIEEEWILMSQSLRKEAVKVINLLESGATFDDSKVQKKLARVNEGSKKLNEYIYNTSKYWNDKNKVVALVGGDHSTPFGHIKAVSERYENLGILHIDAHADLRKSYEGFEDSHASIFYNTTTKIDGIKSLVQVGVRDFCDDEYNFSKENEKITTFYDNFLFSRKAEGESWSSICSDIVSKLPENVYVSFDIDGLSPELCPSTGTPVAGGLSFNESIYLLREITKSGRKIVAFDLCEVCPNPDNTNQWDANVGARILYKLCNLALL